MVKVVFASLIAGAAAGGTLALTWEDCGDASTHGKTDDIEPSEIKVGQDTTITGTGSTDKEITSGTFAMKLTASMGIKDTYTGKICEPATFKIPLNLGTVSWAGMDCPVAVGPSKVVLGVKMASILPAALAKADLALSALDQDGEQAVCVNTHLKKEVAIVSADPTQPHLSQAWTAKSVGDGLPGTIGDEAYFFTDKESHHLWDYGAQGLKLWTCESAYNCVEYYVKLNAVDCCKCEDVDEPKQWDIPKSGLFTKVNFNGFEDTTELNDNPVTGAEHWFTSSALPKVLTVTYDYFLHREDSGDVISHRINFNTSVGQSGEILYGDFAVAHDLDAHKQKFAIPSQCKGNILDCCDQRDEIMSKWFKHDYAVEQAKKAEVSV